MPSYKLCYFHSRGFAEMLRFTFVEAGVDYEDVRFSGEEWPKQKPEMLFNHVPVLFVDGVEIAHSRAALRYLGREFNLDGGDSLTIAKVDMWIEALVEGIEKLRLATKPNDEKLRLATEADEKKKEEEQMAAAFKEFIIPKFEKLENVIQGDYIFGANPNIADFAVYSFLEYLKILNKDDFLANCPKLKKVMAAVASRQKIAEWIKQRPVTAY